MRSSTPRFLVFAFVLLLRPAWGEDRSFVFDWPLPQPSAAQPAASLPVPNVPWLSRVEANIDKLADGPYDLIFDGDSITDFWQSGGAEVWKANYGAMKALDIGIGGDRVENLIWRAQHGSLAGQDPKLLVVMIGTNNTGFGTPAVDIVAGIQALLHEYETRCPHAHILLLGVFPRGFNPDDPGRVAVGAINKILAVTKFDARVTYFDFGAQFLEPDRKMLPTMMGDGLHPGPKGYAIWAKAIQPYVDQYVVHAAGSSSAAAAHPATPRKVTIEWPQPAPPMGTPVPAWPAPRIDWIWDFETNLDKLKDGPYDVVFDGDQAVMGLANQPQWKTLAGASKAVDLGQWWDQVQNITWRAQHGSLAGQNPKLIVVQTGILNHDQPAGDVAAGIKLLIETYQKQCPAVHVLLLGVFPRNPDDPVHSWVQDLNKILTTYGSAKVTFLDLGDKFVGADGRISSKLMPDGVNLSADGYAAWMSAMQPEIERILQGP